MFTCTADIVSDAPRWVWFYLLDHDIVVNAAEFKSVMCFLIRLTYT